MLRSAEFDLAILDVNVGGRIITPVTEIVELRKRPIIFAAGLCARRFSWAVPRPAGTTQALHVRKTATDDLQWPHTVSDESRPRKDPTVRLNTIEPLRIRFRDMRLEGGNGTPAKTTGASSIKESPATVRVQQRLPQTDATH
jgi:hypothetical protein